MNKEQQTLDTHYFNNRAQNDRGLILDYREAVNALPSHTGQDYITTFDWRTRNGSFYSGADKNDLIKQRSIDAEPRIIATFDPHDTDDLIDITANAFNIKKKGNDYIALPQELKTVLPRVHAAVMDLLNLCGADYFLNSEMDFILNRTDVKSDTAQRPHFADWHVHNEKGETTDMIYLMSNQFGTEYKLDQHEGAFIQETILSAPDGSIVRMGGGISHRSPTLTESTLENRATTRREWGALTITSEKTPINRNANNRSHNMALIGRDHSLFETFKAEANDTCNQDKSLHVLETPQTLIEYTNTDLE